MLEKVPDQNGVVVRAADDLKLIKLESEHSTSVLHEGTDAQRTSWSPWVQGGSQVPHFDLAVVGATDDALTVKADASNQLFVALEDPEARTTFNVPQTDSVVRASGHDESVVILQTGNTPLVAAECADKLAGGGVPHLDGTITRG